MGGWGKERIQHIYFSAKNRSVIDASKFSPTVWGWSVSISSNVLHTSLSQIVHGKMSNKAKTVVVAEIKKEKYVCKSERSCPLPSVVITSSVGSAQNDGIYLSMQLFNSIISNKNLSYEKYFFLKWAAFSWITNLLWGCYLLCFMEIISPVQSEFLFDTS